MTRNSGDAGLVSLLRIEAPGLLFSAWNAARDAAHTCMLRLSNSRSKMQRFHPLSTTNHHTLR
jgi:hypothetical protein